MARPPLLAGSTWLVKLAGDGSSDFLAVDGTASIQGGVISTALPRALYLNGFTWDLISASQGVSGVFDSLDYQNSSAVLSLGQQNSGDSLSLVVSRKSYAGFVSGRGAASTGRALGALVPLASGEMQGLLTAMDFDLDAPQITQAVNALNPEMYTAFSAASLQVGRLFDQALALRLSQVGQRRALGLDQEQAAGGMAQAAASETAPLALPAPQDSGVWVRVLGLWADRDAADGYLGRGQDTAGMAFGADYVVNPWLRAGLAAGVAYTDLSWSGQNYSGDLDSFHTGFYAQAGLAGAFARLTASYARLMGSAARPINFEGVSLDARSDFEANLYGAGLSLGYQAFWGGGWWSPWPGCTASGCAKRVSSKGAPAFWAWTSTPGTPFPCSPAWASAPAA